MAKASKLASELIAATGLCCLRTGVMAGHPHHSRLTFGGIADRDSAGERVWFKSQRDAEKVLQATLSRCLDSKKTKAGITAKLPPDHVVDLVSTIAFSLGITPIKDHDVTIAFDSISRRVENAIASMGRTATLKRMRAAVAGIDAAELRSALSR